MSKLMILSPHLDDAVLDCWNIISEGSATVMNIFAGIPPEGTSKLWDRVCGEPDSRKMMHARRQENETAIAISGSNEPQIYLDFLDNQYRSVEPTIDELTQDILAKSPHKSSFLVPLAKSRIYRHPDHVLIRKVGFELIKRGYHVGFYADAPYMSLPRRRNLNFAKKIEASTTKSLGMHVKVKFNNLTTEKQKSKDAAMHAYKTQYKMTNLESFGGLKRIAKRDYEIILEPLATRK